MTVTVDDALVRLGNAAVKSGRAPSLSAWVNTALVERAAKERRLAAMGEAIAAYEAEFGEITDDELVAQRRADRGAAIVITPSPRVAAKPRAVASPRRRRTA